MNLNVIDIYYWLRDAITWRLRFFNWVPALGLRLMLAPVLIVAGLNKFEHFDNTVTWFGEGLGLPVPGLLAFVAAATELVGGLLLVIGLAVRWISVPLMFTMVVAAATVHWEHGWFAIAPSSASTSPARAVAALGIPAAVESQKGTVETRNILNRNRQILQRQGNYEYLTSKGPIVILNNGIEFAAIYFMMLMVLLLIGSGRISIDFWLDRWLRLPK